MTTLIWSVKAKVRENMSWCGSGFVVIIPFSRHSLQYIVRNKWFGIVPFAQGFEIDQKSVTPNHFYHCPKPLFPLRSDFGFWESSFSSCKILTFFYRQMLIWQSPSYFFTLTDFYPKPFFPDTPVELYQTIYSRTVCCVITNHSSRDFACCVPVCT